MGKKSFKGVVVFLVALILLLSLTSALLSSISESPVYDLSSVRRKDLYLQKEEKDSLEVLFLGTSVSLCADSPLWLYQETGITSYNLSSTAQMICDSAAILENALKSQHPSVVIYEADGLFNETQLYSKDDAVFAAMERIFPVFHYHTYLGSSNIFLPQWYKDASEREKYKGFSLNEEVVPTEIDSSVMTRESDDSIGEENIRYFQKMVDLCRENNISFVLIADPAPAEWSLTRHDLCTSLCQEYDVPFVDLNETDIGMNGETDFMDNGVHFNRSGAHKITSWTGSFLETEYGLKPADNPDIIQKWDADLKNSGIQEGE